MKSPKANKYNQSIKLLHSPLIAHPNNNLTSSPQIPHLGHHSRQLLHHGILRIDTFCLGAESIARSCFSSIVVPTASIAPATPVVIATVIVSTASVIVAAVGMVAVAGATSIAAASAVVAVTVGGEGGVHGNKLNNDSQDF